MIFRIKFLSASLLNGVSKLPHNLGLEKNNCAFSSLKFYSENGTQFNGVLNGLIGGRFKTVRYETNEKNASTLLNQYYTFEVQNGDFVIEGSEVQAENVLISARIEKSNQSLPTLLRISLYNANLQSSSSDKYVVSLIDEIDVDFYGEKMTSPILFNGDLSVFYGLRSIYGNKGEIQGSNEFLESWRGNLVKYF